MSSQYSNRIVDPLGLMERRGGDIDPFIFVPRTPRGSIFKDGGYSIPMPTLPDIQGGSVPMPELPRSGGVFGGSKNESCMECRSRQDPNVMHFMDPCSNQCSGGAGDVFKLPDMPFPRGEDRYPDPRIPRYPDGPRDRFPSPDFELLNFPRGGGSSIPDYIVPAAQLLGTFLGKILNKG